MAVFIGSLVAVIGLLVVWSATHIARWAIRVWPRQLTELDRERVETLVFLVRLVGYFAVAAGALVIVMSVT